MASSFNYPCPENIKILAGAGWDPTLPPALNISRIVHGIQPQDDNPSLKFEKSLVEEIESQVASLTHSALDYATIALEDVNRAVNQLNSIEKDSSILSLLQQQIAIFFGNGPSTASVLFESLSSAAESETTDLVIHSDVIEDIPMLPWQSCKLTTTLLLLLSSPQNRIFEAMKLNSRRLGGLPTLTTIRTTPSVSFDQAFREAKALAQSPSAETTVMAVSLVDVHIFELAQAGAAQPWSSFAHTFVVGVGAEGWVIWQSWGDHGYTLQEHIERDGARVRSWEEAEQFLGDFNRLAAGQGTWNSKRNKWYRRCFDVDVNKICGRGKLRRPIVPKYETWVRLHILKNVQREDVLKFHWKVI